MRRLVILVSVLLAVLFFKANVFAEEKAVRVYITNFGGETISVIDTEKNTKIADIKTGAKPHGVAISPDGKHVFVSNEGDNTVSVVNPSTNKVIKQINVGGSPNQLAVTRDGKWVYVTNHEDGTVSVIDVSEFKVIDTIPVGAWPHIAYPSFDGQVMFVTCEKEQKIVIIDIATRKAIDEVFIFGFPRVMDISRDGKTVYITVRWLNGVLLIGRNEHKAVNMIELARSDKFPSDGMSAHGLALTPDGKNLYITSQLLNTVSVIDTSTLKIENEIPVGVNPNWIGFTPDGKFAYVSNTNSSNVSVIDVEKDKVVKSIDVGPKPKRLAVGEVVITQESKEKSIIWNFDKEAVGKLPKGFSNQVTGRKSLGRWEIIEDKTAPSPPYVLAQTSSENFGNNFNLAVIEDIDYGDLELEVKFKAMSGKEDQGGGPIWRYQDQNNYYIARANPLENSFRVYKVVNGNRKQLASANVEMTSGKWHTIKIINVDDRIQCFYDGRFYLEVIDNTFQQGRIGFWTKDDAVTAFDDIKLKLLP